MIHSSTYFYFNNEDCRDYGIINVSKGSGLYEQEFFAERELKEITTESRDTPYYQRIMRKPLQFSTRLYFEDGFTLDDLRRVRNWLDVDFYQPMIFNEDLDRIYYVMPISTAPLSHNGSFEGYVDLQFRCDSPYSYSPIETTSWYDFSTNDVNGKDIVIYNTGDMTCFPIIEIEKVGVGNVSIYNYSNNNQELKFTGLASGEIVKVDCDPDIEDITTSLPLTFRYDNHNDTFTSLIVGKNDLKVFGNCKVRLTTQFKYRG